MESKAIGLIEAKAKEPLEAACQDPGLATLLKLILAKGSLSLFESLA